MDVNDMSNSQYERTPPHDIDAERSVLGGMMLSKDALADVLEILDAKDFYRPAHATIYNTILTLSVPASLRTRSRLLQSYNAKACWNK